MTLDRFGITQIFPTAPGFTEWFSNWDNGNYREVHSMGRNVPNIDPDDPLSDLHCHSYEEEGNWMKIDGNGRCTLYGPHPRLHIHKPVGSQNMSMWRNTEMTVYHKVFPNGFMSDAPYSVADLRTRTNHHAEHLCRCNGLGYVSSFNLFHNFHHYRKEMVHDNYANSPHTSVLLPLDTWIGHKFICRDIDEGTHVKLESYIDMTSGLDGGTWINISEWIDDGNWAVVDADEIDTIEANVDSCDNGCIDGKPSPPWNKIILRRGRDAYLRTDYSANIKFKWMSIREIASLP